MVALKANHGQSVAPADIPSMSAHASPAVPSVAPTTGEAKGPDGNGASKRAIDDGAGSPPPSNDEKELQERVKRQRLE